MEWHRYRLQPLAGTVTPWQADTVLGHFAWDIVHREGLPALHTFLQAFETGNPPFVLSDGCPGDLLPTPMTLPWLYADPDARRAAAGHRWLTLDEFNEVRAGVAPKDLPDTARRDPWRADASLHVRLSRQTLTSGEEGSLYSLEERFPVTSEGEPACVTFYARVRSETAASRLRELFERLSESGYGKKKSSGKGAFRLATAEPFDGFSDAPADAVVTLANVVPAADNPTEGLWRTSMKLGRLGEERALRSQPFKRPFVYLAAGAVFCGGNGPLWLGRTLRGLSTDPDDPGRPGDDVQICLTPTLPCAWPAALAKASTEA